MAAVTPQITPLLLFLVTILIPSICPAPVTSSESFSGEFQEYQQFIKACKTSPNEKATKLLCSAYKDVLENNSRPIDQSLYATAASALREAKASDICAMLKHSLLDLPYDKATDSNRSNNLANEKICLKRCGDVDEDGDEVVLPICKVIAYHLTYVYNKKIAKKVILEHQAVNILKENDGEVSKELASVVAQNVIIPPLIQVINQSNSSTAIVADRPEVPSERNQQISAQNLDTSSKNKTQALLSSIPTKNVTEIAKTEEATGTKTAEKKTDISNSNQNPEIKKQKVESSTAENVANVPPAEEQKPPNKPLISSTSKYSEYDNIKEDEMEEENEEFEEPNPKANINKNDSLDEKSPQNQNPMPVEPDYSIEHSDNSLVPEPQPSQQHDSHKPADVIEDPFYEDTDSNFFAYFMFFMLVCILGYVAYHNRSKLLALMLEGRRTNSARSGSFSTRKKHTAAYRKLDSNLEEAITSGSTATNRTAQIIY